MDLADSLGLVCSLLELLVPTHYLDTDGHANSVIDLIFLGMSCAQVLHCIEPDLRWPSDHASLLVNLSILLENICFSKKVLKHDSDKENNFLFSIFMGLCALNFSRLNFVDDLNLLSKAVSRIISNAWDANARNITATTRSKEWWNNECRNALATYRCTEAREDWHLFCSTTRSTKRSFFDDRIAEIASTNKRPWDLMSWVKQYKLPVVEAIQYQGLSCNSLSNLWYALHSSYNVTANRSVQLSILDDILCLAPQP